MAAQLEEVVLTPDLLYAEQLLPDLCDALFELA
jgi:hypothetical protein